MVTPLRNLYVALIRRILHGKRTSNSSLVLYRLDEDNVLIREDQNASGISTGLRADNIDAMSFKFYQHFFSISCSSRTSILYFSFSESCCGQQVNLSNYIFFRLARYYCGWRVEALYFFFQQSISYVANCK